MRRLHLRQRKSGTSHRVALHAQSGLYRDGIDLAEQRVHKIQGLELQLAGFIIAWVSLGATLESTEITPMPPREQIGTIWSSLPE